MAFYVFQNQSGNVAASHLDDNFNLCATAANLTTTNASIAALPSNVVPLIPVAGGSAGVSAALARDDHQHPPQSATLNSQVGTTYTVLSSDNGKVVELANASAITVTVPNSLPVGFNCLFTQAGTAQVTFAAASGATQRQRQSYTKTAGQWAVVSLYVRANSGGSAAEYVLAGDMAA